MDISVLVRGQVQDLRLKNPVLTASGTFGSGIEFAPFGDLAELGGIIVKGVSLKPRQGNPAPRIAETPAGMLNAIGLQNDGAENFLRFKLPRLPWRDTAIIANLYAESIGEFEELAALFNDEEGIAAIEINVSCPNVQKGGALFGQDPRLTELVTQAARKGAPRKHLMVKLSPNVTDIREIAAAAESGGADSVSCINTLLGMAVDSRTRRPMLANVVGGLSGPAIKPVALRCVWQVSRAVKIPVIGVGGVTTPEDIAEFMLCGACAVQVGTANFMRPDASFRLARELPRTLADLGFGSARDAVGGLEV